MRKHLTVIRGPFQFATNFEINVTSGPFDVDEIDLTDLRRTNTSEVGSAPAAFTAWIVGTLDGLATVVIELGDKGGEPSPETMLDAEFELFGATVQT